MPATNKMDFGYNRFSPARLGSILDQTQGNLILKWNASLGAERLRRIGLPTLYCCVALTFLMIFAIENLSRGKASYSLVLFGFSALTICSYFYLRVTGNKRRTNAFLVVLLGSLCLFLLYTGGVEGTGPLWYYVFPLFALFVQRLWAGVVSVVSLLLITLIVLVSTGNSYVYPQAFIERFLSVYIAVSAMSFLYAFLRASQELELVNLNQHLRELAGTDELTQLLNRRSMQSILYQETSRARRNNSRFSIIVFDVDRFKSINDEHGHEAGDNVLVELSMRITEALRTQDICSRWGGEEFLVLLPDTGIEAAGRVAERLRAATEEMVIEYEGKRIAVTSSFGVREFNPEDELDVCLREADRNLYQAKASGRNCVVS